MSHVSVRWLLLSRVSRNVKVSFIEYLKYIRYPYSMAVIENHSYLELDLCGTGFQKCNLVHYSMVSFEYFQQSQRHVYQVRPGCQFPQLKQQTKQ